MKLTPSLADFIKSALAEDIGHGDITTIFTVSPDAIGSAVVIAKQEFVLAGLDVFRDVLLAVDSDVIFNSDYHDGARISTGTVIAEISGRLASLLTGERVALNLLQSMSGVATLTSRYVEAISGTNTTILDTRKTTPGLRALEKYAVTVGGGKNHRFGLYDGILIKDNHIAAAGGITRAVEMARLHAPHTLKVEVECETIADVTEALAAGADIIMLDNMDTKRMTEAVGLIDRQAVTEASGNMTLERIREVALTGVDYISVGALTHSAVAVDVSMKIRG